MATTLTLGGGWGARRRMAPGNGNKDLVVVIRWLDRDDVEVLLAKLKRLLLD
jgi:hypothetical protein